FVRVALQNVRDPVSTTWASPWLSGPKLRAIVACGVSRSGSSAAPAVTPANMNAPPTVVGPPHEGGRTAAIASPAAAPLIAWVGPMTMLIDSLHGVPAPIGEGGQDGVG